MIFRTYLLLLLFSCSFFTHAQDTHSTNTEFDVAGPVSGGIRDNSDLPHVPSIYRNVTGIIDTQHSRPHIPPMRLTRDGRLGTSSRGHNESLALYLLIPEQVSKPFVEEVPGVDSIMNDAPAYSINYSELGLNEARGIRFAALCEANRGDLQAKQNPYVCGTDNKDDCYDVSVIGGAGVSHTLLENYAHTGITKEDLGGSSREILISVPLTVRVKNPKTTDAYITQVDIHHEDIHLADKSYQTAIFEPLTPADGRLFVTRTDGQSLTWFNENSGEYEQGYYDVVYSVADKNAPACDAKQWNNFYPISHAPYDIKVNSRYDFASRPFRDPMGNVIEDGADIKGTYPWIDSGAKNLTVTILPTALYDAYMSDPNNTTARYPSRCVIDGCDRTGLVDEEIGTINDMGFVIFGSWTLGKMVLLDGVLNDIDFKLGPEDRQHSYVSLYAPATGLTQAETGEVRMGGTRATGNQYPSSTFPRGSGRNLTMFDSIEARFNYLDVMKPVTPRDVSWLASSGRHSDEFSFDDYLHPDSFIVSNMVGAVDATVGNIFKAFYHDGWNGEDQAFTRPVYIQNSATAERARWHTPTHGVVNNSRLEPAALGGVRGKGLWLNGVDSSLTYDIPAQPRRIDAYPWYIHLFIDPRLDNPFLPIERALIEFPDHSQITLLGETKIRYRSGDGVIVNEIELPKKTENKSWTSLGFEVRPDGRAIRFFHNGYPTDDWRATDEKSTTADKPGIFQFTPGQLILGKTSSVSDIKPFKGWIDEFKVFAQGVTEEVACNHAMGTLAAISPAYKEGKWRDVANNYKPSQHGMITEALKAKAYSSTYEQYVCYADYSDDYVAHLSNIPEGMIGLSQAINFPEGPLMHDAPRPDSSYNEFCLSCHTPSSKTGLLDTALSLNPNTPAEADPRRQPLQPNPHIYGNIPKNWLPNSPNTPLQLGNSGEFIDRWLLESAEGKTPAVLGLTLVNADTGEDLFAISDGMIIDLSTLRSPNLNIRAVSNGLTRKVSFDYDGTASSQGHAPFALFGKRSHGFDSGILTPGEHSLSAIAQGSNNDAISISFTVTGLSPTQAETGSNPVLTPVDYGIRDSEISLNGINSFFQAIADFFQTLGQEIVQYITRVLSTLFDLPNTDASAFNSSGISIFIDQALRDNETILIEGRLEGANSPVLSINNTPVETTKGTFSYRITDHLIDRYSLIATNDVGGTEETVISFSKQQVSNGITLKIDKGSAFFSYAAHIVNQDFRQGIEDAANAEIANALKEPIVNWDGYVVKILSSLSATMHNLEIAEIKPGDENNQRINIEGSITTEIKGTLTSSLQACIPYWWFGAQRHCLPAVALPIDYQINNVDAGAQASIKKYDGEDFGIFILLDDIIDIHTHIDGIQLIAPGVPDSLQWVISPLNMAINVTHNVLDYLFNVDTTIAQSMVDEATIDELIAQLNSVLNQFSGRETGRFISQSLVERANLYPHNSNFPIPEFLKPYLDAYIRSTGLQLDVDYAATKNNANIFSINANWLSTTSDNQVNFGYREIQGESNDKYDMAFFEALPKPIDIHQDLLIFLRGQLLNQLYAALSQEHFMDTKKRIDIDRLVDVKEIVAFVRSDEKISKEDAVIEALDTLLTNNDVVTSIDRAEDQTGYMGGMLNIRVGSAPYLQLPENPNTISKLRIDNIQVSINTLRDTYDKLDGTEGQLIVQASMDIIAELDFKIEEGNVITSLVASNVQLTDATVLDLDLPEDIQKAVMVQILKHHLPNMLNGITIYSGLAQIPGEGKVNAKVWRPDPSKMDIAVSVDVVY